MLAGLTRPTGTILNYSRFVFLALLPVLLYQGGAPADDGSDLAALLVNNTYPIDFERGDLSGPGADLILQLAGGTQFVALGEEHNNFHIPAITTALFGALKEHYGYRYFMTEQDPVIMEIFSSSPTRGNPEKINSLAQRYPMGVTFNSDQELQMLADLGRISDAGEDVIWGCDQGAGVTHTLDQLLQELQDDKAIAAVTAFRQISAEKEAVRDYSLGHFMADVGAEEILRLKADVNPAQGSRSEWLLDVLVNSSRIFDFYRNGQKDLLPGYYENNRFREEHLKDLCLARYRAAAERDATPKALMKFGSWHIYTGLSPTRVHTIGDFFSGVARYNGQGFLSVMFVSRPQDPQEEMDNLGFVWPFIRDLDPDEFAIVDLRPFRRYPNRLLVEKEEGEAWVNAHKESYVRLVYGYDLIFFIGNSKDATFEVVPEAG